MWPKGGAVEGKGIDHNVNVHVRSYSGEEMVREESKGKTGEMYVERWMGHQSPLCIAKGDCVVGARADLPGVGRQV